jgi:HEAT repeat protein
MKAILAALAAAGLFCGNIRAVELSASDQALLKSAGLLGSEQALLDYLRKRELSPGDRAHIKTLIAELGDDSFAVREKASQSLVAHGLAAQPMLREALRNNDAEIARRAEECLQQIRRESPALLKAALRAVEIGKPMGAAEVLLGLLPVARDDGLPDLIGSALTAVAVRQGTSDPALVRALSHSEPMIRAGAAHALIGAHAPGAIEQCARLLHDPNAAVEVSVGIALARQGERQAFPVLIDRLRHLSVEDASPVAELLERLAGASAPMASLGQDDAARARYQAAWADWWSAHGKNADLKRLTEPGSPLGFTLMMLLDMGEAREVDRDNHIRWQITGLNFPLDIQYLPGGRVLVAEHDGNTVTERDLQGNVIWERKIDQPLVAQRLANGNTFIATSAQLVEVDRAGQAVFSVTPASNDTIMKAQKLPNGDMACVLTNVNAGGARVAVLDAQGQEIRGFNVNLRTSGGRVEVLSNGNVLLPEMAANPERETNRVVEYDVYGKEVWELDFKQLGTEAHHGRPIAAVRLANGNTLVTMQGSNRAAEFDRAGRLVWEYRAPNPQWVSGTDPADKYFRINRAFRR